MDDRNVRPNDRKRTTERPKADDRTTERTTERVRPYDRKRTTERPKRTTVRPKAYDRTAREYNIQYIHMISYNTLILSLSKHIFQDMTRLFNIR